MTTNYKNGYRVLTSETCVKIYEGKSIESGELIALE